MIANELLKPGDHSEPVLSFVELARKKLVSIAPNLESIRSDVPPTGDHVLSPEIKDIATGMPPKPEAVLVPVMAREQPTVLLTLRTDTLPTHAGQISFPGGKLDATDPDPLATALREAQEEIGLEPGFVDPLGYLEPYLSGTGFRIVPVVALVSPAFDLKLNPAEVAETFEVPLEFLMQPQNHLRDSREWRGRQRSFYAITHGERYIWGITAGILRNLYERLYR